MRARSYACGLQIIRALANRICDIEVCSTSTCVYTHIYTHTRIWRLTHARRYLSTMHISDTRFHGMVGGIYHTRLCIARVLRVWYVVCQYHAALPKICTGYVCTWNIHVYIYRVAKHNKREYAIRTVFSIPILYVYISLHLFLSHHRKFITYFSSIFIVNNVQYIYIYVIINLETNFYFRIFSLIDYI